MARWANCGSIEAHPLALAGTIKLSDDADDMAYDAVRQLSFVGHGGKDAANPANVAIVNTAEFRLKANVAVARIQRDIAVDPKSGASLPISRMTDEVAVIDAKTKAITAHWKLTKAADNVPVAFDEKDHLLFVACRKPGMLIALDAATGKEIAALPAAGGADDLFYDPALGRVYLISGTGEVDAFQVGPEKALHKLGIVPTAAGAKTALFVSSQNLLYLAVPGAGVHPSEIRVYGTVKNGISHGSTNFLRVDYQGNVILETVKLPPESLQSNRQEPTQFLFPQPRFPEALLQELSRAPTLPSPSPGLSLTKPALFVPTTETA